MHRTDSPVRAAPCQTDTFFDVHWDYELGQPVLPLPKGEGRGEGEVDVQSRVGLSQTHGSWKRGRFLTRALHFLSVLGRCLKIAALVLVLLITPACKPKEIQTLLGPSQALSSVLAEEAAHVAGAKKQVALITADASWGPPSTLEEALKRALKRHGLTVVTAKAANLGNPMLSGAIGLKAVDFFEALEKSAGTGAVISLVGGPLLTPDDAARVSSNHPPVLVVATAMLGDKIGVRTDPLQLARLLETQVIEIAVIDGADPVANVPGKSDPARELFAQNYRILRRPR